MTSCADVGTGMGVDSGCQFLLPAPPGLRWCRLHVTCHAHARSKLQAHGQHVRPSAHQARLP